MVLNKKIGDNTFMKQKLISLYNLLNKNSFKINLFIFLLNLISFLSVFYLLRSGKSNFWDYPPFAIFTYINSSYIFGDLLIFSLFFAIAFGVFLLLKLDLRYSLLFYFSWMFLRHFGEAIYWFNYQFAGFQPHEIRNQFEFLTGPLAANENMILYQIINQVHAAVFGFAVILILKNWKKLAEI